MALNITLNAFSLCESLQPYNVDVSNSFTYAYACIYIKNWFFIHSPKNQWITGVTINIKGPSCPMEGLHRLEIILMQQQHCRKSQKGPCKLLIQKMLFNTNRHMQLNMTPCSMWWGFNTCFVHLTKFITLDTPIKW